MLSEQVQTGGEAPTASSPVRAPVPAFRAWVRASAQAAPPNSLQGALLTLSWCLPRSQARNR